MKAVTYLAVLVGMLVPFPGLVCSQADNQRASAPNHPRAESGKLEARETLLTKTPGSRYDPDGLARAMTAKAAVLRQKQTGADLVASIRLLQQIARLLQPAHRTHQ